MKTIFFVPTVFSHNRDFTGVYLYVNSRKGHKKAGELTGHKRLDLKVFHCDCHSFSSHNIDCKQNEKKHDKFLSKTRQRKASLKSKTTIFDSTSL